MYISEEHQKYQSSKTDTLTDCDSSVILQFGETSVIALPLLLVLFDQITVHLAWR